MGEQTHPHYQRLFGVSDPHDPAIRVVKRLRAIYSHLDIELIVDSRVHDSNFKRGQSYCDITAGELMPTN